MNRYSKKCSKEECFAKIREKIIDLKEFNESEAASINMESYIDYNEIGMDSLQLLTLLVCLEDECDGTAEELYVIPLDSTIIRDHRFSDDFYAHQHIDLPLATLATPEDLDETMRKNYFDYISYLNEQKS